MQYWDSSIDLLAIFTVYIGPGLDRAEKAQDSWLMACPQPGFKAVYQLVFLSSPGRSPNHAKFLKRKTLVFFYTDGQHE